MTMHPLSTLIPENTLFFCASVNSPACLMPHFCSVPICLSAPQPIRSPRTSHELLKRRALTFPMGLVGQSSGDEKQEGGGRTGSMGIIGTTQVRSALRV